ncbi:MAG: hypothetical protein AAGI24_03520 [Pseudomonadota bacterium]
MDWDDAKKWRMDLVSKCVVGLVIASVGAISAVLIDQRVQSKLAESNRALQQEFASDKFRLNRLEVEAQALETLAGEFMYTAYAYSVALESAFNDVYFKHQDYNAQTKGKNQLRYETELRPKLMALSDQLVARCSDTEPAIGNLRSTQETAFEAYDIVEDAPRNATPTPEWHSSARQIDMLVPNIREDAARAYVLIENCIERIAGNAKFGRVGA